MLRPEGLPLRHMVLKQQDDTLVTFLATVWHEAGMVKADGHCEIRAGACWEDLGSTLQ